MSFMEGVRACFTRYAGFTGRARRSEYWWFSLFFLLVVLIAQSLDASLFDVDPTADESGPVSTVVTLLTFLPGTAVTARRLHDTGRSGWWQLLWLIPILGWVPLIIWLCQDGRPGTNEHGPNPKGVGDPVMAYGQPGSAGAPPMPGQYDTRAGVADTAVNRGDLNAHREAARTTFRGNGFNSPGDL